MNANDFTYLLNNPNAVSEQQALLLDKIVAEFPYFQSARALQLKVLHNQNDFRYNQSLKVTAAHTTDRNVLFEFITSEDFAVLPTTSVETISIAETPGKIVEVSHIPVVEKTEESIPTSNVEATTATEKTIETVSETISIAESPEKIIEVSHIPVEEKTEESIPTSNTEATPATEKTVESSEIISIAESPEKIIQVSHIPVENKLEQSILSSIIGATPKEKADKISVEEKIDSKLEKSILSSIIEATSTTDKTIEPETADEIPVEEKIDSKLEKSILSSIIEATSTTDKTIEQEVVSEVPAEEKTEEQTIEEKLEIGQPLDFSKQEKHSFQEWLQLASLQPIKRTETVEPIETPEIEDKNIEPEIEKRNIEEDEERKKKSALIDKFIETNPKISPASKNATATPFISEQPAIENSYLMTETLAKVYLEQKKYQKAIQAYEILILKYPEKISFFANRISDIKALQQNNN